MGIHVCLRPPCLPDAWGGGRIPMPSGWLGPPAPQGWTPAVPEWAAQGQGWDLGDPGAEIRGHQAHFFPELRRTLSSHSNLRRSKCVTSLASRRNGQVLVFFCLRIWLVLLLPKSKHFAQNSNLGCVFFLPAPHTLSFLHQPTGDRSAETMPRCCGSRT